MCLRCQAAEHNHRRSTQSNLNINNNTCNLPIADKTPMKGYSHFSKCMSEACVVLKNGQQVVLQGPDGVIGESREGAWCSGRLGSDWFVVSSLLLCTHRSTLCFIAT